MTEEETLYTIKTLENGASKHGCHHRIEKDEDGFYYHVFKPPEPVDYTVIGHCHAEVVIK